MSGNISAAAKAGRGPSESKKSKSKKSKQEKKAKETPAAMVLGRDDLQDERVVSPMNPWLGKNDVKVRGYSRRYLKEFQQAALDRFEGDWNAAFGSTLRGAAWKPKVDVSSTEHRAHLARLDAQTRLARLREEIGGHDYRVLEAVVIGNLSPTQISAAGGPKKDIVSEKIRVISTRVAAFYGDRRQIGDPLMLAIERIEEAVREAARSLQTGHRSTGESGEEARRRTAAAR